jgi:addiction module HigA family antidote
LEEFMKPMGISINKLARDIAVAPGRISDIVNGQRTITADTALRLSKYFGVSAELWLGLQANFDLRIAKRTVGPKIDKQVHARVA